MLHAHPAMAIALLQYMATGTGTGNKKIMLLHGSIAIHVSVHVDWSVLVWSGNKPMEIN